MFFVRSVGNPDKNSSIRHLLKNLARLLLTFLPSQDNTPGNDFSPSLQYSHSNISSDGISNLSMQT